jgi:hypothetical protein
MRMHHLATRPGTTIRRLAILGVMALAWGQHLPAAERGTSGRGEPQASAVTPALVSESEDPTSTTHLASADGPALSRERPTLVDERAANGTAPTHQRFVLSSSSPRLEFDRSLRAGPIEGPEAIPAAEHPVLDPGAPDKEPPRR